MEKFEINEYGILTDYYNDDKNVTEITIPDSVKWLNDGIFNEYQNIYTVTLPIIKYRGVTFKNSFHMINIFEMIRDKDYSCVLDHNVKYPVVLQIYFNDGDDVTTAYIKKNFRKFFVFLIHELDVQNRLGFSMHIKDALNIIERLVKSGKFITKRNIDTYVKLADEKECHEVFDMLNEYKEEVLKK